MPTPSSRTPVASLEPRDVALGLAPLVAGTAVGIATNADGSRWFRRLSKPAWTPPDAVFGPVWSILYGLMGIAAVLVARTGRDERGPAGRGRAGVRPALGLFGLQLVLNLGWSLVFFGARRVRLAGLELAALWASIALTVVAFLRVRLAAGLLLLPYLAWTTFAGALNLDLARRNPRA